MRTSGVCLQQLRGRLAGRYGLGKTAALPGFTTRSDAQSPRWAPCNCCKCFCASLIVKTALGPEPAIYGAALVVCHCNLIKPDRPLYIYIYARAEKTRIITISVVILRLKKYRLRKHDVVIMKSAKRGGRVCCCAYRSTCRRSHKYI